MNTANINSNILSYLFQSNYDDLYKVINDKPIDLSIDLSMKFEILDDKWNLYNKYFQEKTSILDDTIIEYRNPVCLIKNFSFYKYSIGGAIYKDEHVININTDSSNVDVLLMNFSATDHKYISSIGNLEKYNYKNIVTQSFKFDSENNLLRKFIPLTSIKYLENWNITKNVIMNSSIAKKFPQNLDINHPKIFDELELIFNYEGNINELEKSLISLIEFLYLTNPKFSIHYQNISFEYQYFNLQINKRLNNFINKSKIIKPSEYKSKIKIPENSIQYLMIYIADDNFILLDKSKIDFSNFKTINSSENYNHSEIYNFALINVFYSENKFIASDIYYLDRLLNENSYEERIKNLDLIIPNSKLIVREIDSKDLMSVYHFDDISKIYLIPNQFFINLRVVRNFDETSYLLYSSTEPISTPLMKSNIFQPQVLRSQIERLIYEKSLNIDNDIVKFSCEFNNGWIDLKPVEIMKNVEADAISDIYMTILSAYYKLSKSKYLIKNHNNYVEYVSQLIIEKLNRKVFKNVLIYSTNFDVHSLISIGESFLNYDRFVFCSSESAIVKNMFHYYQNEFNQLRTIIPSTRFVRSLNRNIYTVNLNNSICKIPSIYRKDMNLIITDFQEYHKLSKFIETLEFLMENISSDGLIIFNYIRSIENIEDLLMFIFDIDKYVNSLDDSEDKNLFIDIERFSRDDTSKLLKIIRNNRTIIKTKSSLGSKNDSRIIMKINDYRVYLFDFINENKSSIYNYSRSLIKSQIESNEKIINDPIQIILNQLSSFLKFNCKFDLMIEDAKILEKNNEFDYSKFVSVNIQV